MKTIHSIDAYYPSYRLGSSPRAVPCYLAIIEADDGERYLRTPSAFMKSFQPDDCERQIALGHYYATEAECLDYLHSEYPHAQMAAPIMDALERSIRYHGDLVGAGRVADKVGVSTDGPASIYQLARGHRRFSAKTIKAALKALSTRSVGVAC